MQRHFIILTAFVAFLFAPAMAQAQITLGGEAAPVDVPFTIEGSHILLSVKLNGHGPYYFSFDTGAPNVLTPGVAQELNLDVKGAALAVGFGNQRVASSLTTIASAQVGDLSLEDQSFSVIELLHHIVDRGNRPKLAGLIGRDLLDRYVVHFDFDRLIAKFIPNSGFSYAGGGAMLDISLQLRKSPWGGLLKLPLVSATIDGKPVTLMVDTGDGSAANIFPRSELADQLKALHSDQLRVFAPGGIGGPVNADVMRVNGLEIAGLEAGNQPFVSVINDGIGFNPSKIEMGTLGLGSLAHFNPIFDYQRHSIFLEPRIHVAQKTNGPGLRGTGLQLTKNVQDRFAILNVVPGSPADQAGISTGDEIFTIDGRPASEMALFDYGPLDRSEMPISISVGSETHRREVRLEKRILLR